MIREALADTLGHLKTLPLLWLGGLITGLVTVGDILVMGSDPISAGSSQIIAFLVFPLIIAGSYGIIREKKSDLSLFGRYVIGYYFRVILPLIMIVFAIFLTILLVFLVLAVIGITPTADMIVFISMGVAAPIIILTYFYDTFAVFKDERIFDSIRSSVTLVLIYSWKILLFIIVNIALLLLLLIALGFLWIGLLWEQVSAIGMMDPDIISTMTGEEVMALLGPDALLTTAVVLFIWAFIATPFTIAFKASFFQRLEERSSSEDALPEVGVYDEKGRWYKY